MDPLNQVIFDDKTFSDLLKEIHTNQKKKGKQILLDLMDPYFILL